MASVTVEKRNGKSLFRVEYRDKDKRRRKVRLGSIAKRDAQAIAAKVQSIVSAQAAGNDLPAATAEWLSAIGDDLHARLAEQGLCKPRAQHTLGEWLSHYLRNHKSRISDFATKSLERSQTLLELFFGSDRLLRDIGLSDAQSFRDWLTEQGYAQASISKHVKHAKQFFNAAVKAEALAKSPFTEVVAGSQSNDERSVYVSAETVAKAIDMAPDKQWRLIIALARFAGLRTPSETLNLRWSDVDFVKGTLTVRCTKTAKQGKSKRTLPILPELRPYLEDAFDPQNERCITRYRTSNNNLRKMFLEILNKAGLEPWPRLFHNLRGSLQTDLINRYPAHAVCEWLGNSERVALQHYLKTTPEHIAEAVVNGVTQVGQQVGTPLAETTSERGNEPKAITQKRGKSGNFRVIAFRLIGPEGLRTSCELAGETQGVGQGVGTPIAIDDEKLDELISLWPSLSEALKSELLKRANGEA